jgi:hypothetical protein
MLGAKAAKETISRILFGSCSPSFLSLIKNNNDYVDLILPDSEIDVFFKEV